MSRFKTFAVKIIDMWDSCFKSDIRRKISKVKSYWHNSYFLNTIRCLAAAIAVRLYYCCRKNEKSFRLHLGCGNRHLEGYVNIDHRKTPATDLVCDCLKLPYPSNCVELIEIYHVIEHFQRHDVPAALACWHRILKPGGKLIIECPDFDVIAEEYVEGKKSRIDDIFGLQRFSGDAHHFGYSFKTLEELLRAAGFKNIEKKEPQDYHAATIPSLRVECAKDIAV